MLLDQQLLGISQIKVHSILKYSFNLFTILVEILGKVIQHLGEASQEWQNLKHGCSCVETGRASAANKPCCPRTARRAAFFWLISYKLPKEHSSSPKPSFCIQTLCLQMAPQQGPSRQMEERAGCPACPRAAQPCLKKYFFFPVFFFISFSN